MTKNRRAKNLVTLSLAQSCWFFSKYNLYSILSTMGGQARSTPGVSSLVQQIKFILIWTCSFIIYISCALLLNALDCYAHTVISAHKFCFVIMLYSAILYSVIKCGTDWLYGKFKLHVFSPNLLMWRNPALPLMGPVCPLNFFVQRE